MTKILNMAYSEPDFDTPEPIKDALVRSLMQGKTKYSAPAGEELLRQAIAEQILLKERTCYDYKSQVLITPGVRQAWYYLLQVLPLKNQDVIVFEPSWSYYIDMLKKKEANIIPYTIYSEEFDAEKFESLVTPNTQLVILNNPTNPSGRVWRKHELKRLVEICKKYNFLIAVDEMYKDLVYLNENIPTFLSLCDDIRERTIIFRGFSKSYAMTGWRVGYVLASPQILKILLGVQAASIANVPVFIQEACVTAIQECHGYVENMRNEFRKRRDLLFEALMTTTYFKALKPEAGLFMLMDISTWASSSSEACKFLLEQGILTTPGGLYGPSANRYVRLSYCVSETVLTNFLDMIRVLDERFKHDGNGGI